jgi:hypothetical protein
VLFLTDIFPTGWQAAVQCEIEPTDSGAGPRLVQRGPGLAEMLAPGQAARTIGLGRKRRLFRLYGIRETAAGIGLLLSGQRAPWLLARAGGDMLGYRDSPRSFGAAESAAGRGYERNGIGVADHSAGCAWRGAAGHGADTARVGAGLQRSEGYPDGLMW